MSNCPEITKKFQKIAEETANTSNQIEEIFPDRLKSQPQHIYDLLLPNYQKIANIRTENERKIWINACYNYVVFVEYFIKYYLQKYQLIELIMLITMPKKLKRNIKKNFNKNKSYSTESQEEGFSVDELNTRRLINDLIILLKWNEVKSTFLEHVNRLANIPSVDCKVDIKIELDNYLFEVILPNNLKLASERSVVVID